MAQHKVLTEEGVQRLWAAIEAKFIDINELTDYVPMTNADIDVITGYEEEQEPEQPAGE